MKKVMTVIFTFLLILSFRQKVSAEENSFTRTIHLYTEEETCYTVKVPNRFTATDQRAVFSIETKGLLDGYILNIETAKNILLVKDKTEILNLTLSKNQVSEIDEEYSKKGSTNLIISPTTEGREKIQVPLRFSLEEVR